MNLWHVSEQAGIERFEPRMPPSTDVGITVPVVWAVADSHLGNYLLPRDCPRVCVRAGAATTSADQERFIGSAERGIAIYIEQGWHDRAAAAVLWLYRLAPASFRCVDANAGYHVSTQAQVPVETRRIDAPLDALTQRGIAWRTVADLRELASQVAASSLAFSIIRLRHAAPHAVDFSFTPKG